MFVALLVYFYDTEAQTQALAHRQASLSYSPEFKPDPPFTCRLWLQRGKAAVCLSVCHLIFNFKQPWKPTTETHQEMTFSPVLMFLHSVFVFSEVARRFLLKPVFSHVLCCCLTGFGRVTERKPGPNHRAWGDSRRRSLIYSQGPWGAEGCPTFHCLMSHNFRSIFALFFSHKRKF